MPRDGAGGGPARVGGLGCQRGCCGAPLRRSLRFCSLTLSEAAPARGSARRAGPLDEAGTPVPRRTGWTACGAGREKARTAAGPALGQRDGQAGTGRGARAGAVFPLGGPGLLHAEGAAPAAGHVGRRVCSSWHARVDHNGQRRSEREFQFVQVHDGDGALTAGTHGRSHTDDGCVAVNALGISNS